ncbi:MAG: hypothetical protein H8M99_05775 [Gloeobacteraceae cyanobacterium ES-bin-144]|nr:hypothetical protein [Verrucomicrobiales bacterium]
MNRRNFITTSGLLAVGTTVASSAEVEAPLLDWAKVQNVHEFTAKCSQSAEGEFPNIRLRVSLKADDPESARSEWLIKNIIRFELIWDDQQILIPERFWNDIVRMEIFVYPENEQSKVPDAMQWKLKDELGQLRQPRVKLSAGKGTVLIEWERGEECDGRSTFRWMVTKNGTVLRHHDLPLHQC